MAEIPVLEAAPGQETAEPAGGGKKKLILIAAIALVVLLAGGAAAFFMMGAEDEATEAADEAAEAAPKGPPLYVALDPPFVVNFEADSAVRFLQVTVQIMSRDPHTVELLKSSDPVIRNDLLLLLGNQKYETIASLEGKEKLRAESLETVRRIVKDGGGEPALVEAVYFTSFVMQ
jgi:flagellar FliL protein